MPKLSPLSFHEFIKKLKKFGFKGPYSGGKHLYMIKDNLRLTLPNPHRKAISVDLLIKILNHAGITREKWLQK
ncbi:MAG: type II toxin-antitoxin system HicA family toxin [Candidatus Infernicultor aquiphilus]|jgi:predicted RNA binding protein YcfA (HicA-like mRNA interferase family)|uniref:Type II toxin-antitoxin system HicA family toxin n=1 Tax=Candidatus Infernicultor aquiphilus TaxID=1805029 RepID=A0A2M7PRL0_9BACT|nr:MAG: type II toxin-antitoxin system HicA family toxin [Candidatus Atribacteria bacterium CG_4_10_14_3_um_filter_34_13]